MSRKWEVEQVIEQIEKLDDSMTTEDNKTLLELLKNPARNEGELKLAKQVLNIGNFKIKKNLSQKDISKFMEKHFEDLTIEGVTQLDVSVARMRELSPSFQEESKNEGKLKFLFSIAF